MSLEPALAAVDCDALSESAWRMVQDAARLAPELEVGGQPASFAAGGDEGLVAVPSGSSSTILAWIPGSGWTPQVDRGDMRFALLDLYLPVCSATPNRPIVVGHLGQSLDGFIATHSGDSQFVTGSANILHLHRMRALCDAIVVGAGTVAADDPQLTTRRVSGPNPLRVIFDPTRRLAPTYRVFTDNAVETWYVCAGSRVEAGESHIGDAIVVGVDDEDTGRAMEQLLTLLRRRGCARVFVEGGGVTVSSFLVANLLDRLQIAVAPLLIGDGRPAIRLAPQDRLSDCRRLEWKIFRMGDDVLFDCAFIPAPAAGGADAQPVTRII
jgi:diaminohydroxyphosphoribosylaminopyrimidine deaminase/5-amino-6-(5-phosphoribosylamino)uracil reductase